jgi:hypothetical protein
MLFANGEKIRRELNWSARYTDIDAIVATAWKWFQKHPDGYEMQEQKSRARLYPPSPFTLPAAFTAANLLLMPVASP